MHQKIDFFDWESDQAYSVYEWMDKTGLLEDAEIIVEVDGVAHGFLEFHTVASDEVMYLAENWENITHVEFNDVLNRLEVYELCFEFVYDGSEGEEDDIDE